MRIIAVAIALTLALAASSAFAQSNPDRVNPGRYGDETQAKKPQAEERDHRAEAMKRFEAWKDNKAKCYTEAGLVENKTFRFNPENGEDIQVHSSVWRSKDFDHAAIAKCKAMK